jgi:hypothetical protein
LQLIVFDIYHHLEEISLAYFVVTIQVEDVKEFLLRFVEGSI